MKPLPIDNRKHKQIDKISSTYFFSRASDVIANNYLSIILTLPYSSFIEINNKNSFEHLSCYLPKGNPDIFISLTTRSCYVSNISQEIVKAVAGRFNLKNIENITTCLHEAVVNAVLHGNLGIKNNFSCNNGFFYYKEQIESLIEAEEHAAKRVYISFWNNYDNLIVSVEDEGNGFDIPDFTITENTIFPRGRGLMFINSLSKRMWQEKNKNTLFMQFSHH